MPKRMTPEDFVHRVELLDKIKNNYCSKNNIFLLRIRPEENMIEKIENFLSRIRLQKKKDNEYEKV